MACNCGAVPAPQEKHSYLVDLLDAKTNRWGQCVVQTECLHDLQEWFTKEATKRGGLTVDDKETGDKFTMHNPVVMKVDAKAASHVPLVDPV